jgi:conjugal transfer pilus assembly protein TraD
MVDDVLIVFLLVPFASLAGGSWVARTLRKRGLLWSCAAPGWPVGFVLWLLLWPVGMIVMGVSVYACLRGWIWHRTDLNAGGDHATIANARLGVLDLLERRRAQQQIEQVGWVSGGRMVVGRDENGMPVSIPVGYESGSHTLVLGATGSGKTVSEAWIACRLIEQGHGGIVVDPKGDEMLRYQLQTAAARRGARFLEWTPEGPLAYNPYAHGTDTEIADKALSGEHFTEPHYLRQAQRYLGHAVRTMHAAKVSVTPASLVSNLDPRELEVTARALTDDDATAVRSYLDGLTDRQKRDLAGIRDRLSILSESDTGQWLDPTDTTDVLDLRKAIAEQAVVYFRLDSDRRMLLSAMLSGVIVSDLVTLTASRQRRPMPTVVMIDEFSAIAAAHVSRLFGRGRSAGISLILGTHEIADLPAVGEGLREQVLANVATIVAHRQNIPESAELIANIAGTKAVWITTQQTEQSLFGATVQSGKATRRRGHEYQIHPSEITGLPTGWAVIITPGSQTPPATAQMHHPSEA